MTKQLKTYCDRCGKEISAYDTHGVSMRVKRHRSTYASDDIVRTHDFCTPCGTRMIQAICDAMDEIRTAP